MPSIKIAKKSTDTDMTPFVDIGFLILSFFIMATKFKPPEPVPITTPNSVSSQTLPQNDAVIVLIDSTDRVYFSILSEKPEIFSTFINDLNTDKNLNLSQAEMANFKKTIDIGVPFASLKNLLGMTPEEQKGIRQPGIPVLDSATNELVWWISEAKKAFAGGKLQFLIKGDNVSKFPTFDGVVSALKRNEEFKYNLVTAAEDVPPGSDLDIYNKSRK